MTIHILFNPAVSMSEPIHSVECIRHSDREEIGLCFSYSDDIELQLREAFNFSDEVVEVT